MGPGPLRRRRVWRQRRVDVPDKPCTGLPLPPVLSQHRYRSTERDGALQPWNRGPASSLLSYDAIMST